MYLASSADFAGVDDTINNLAKAREPGDIECAPLSLIIYLLVLYYDHMVVNCNESYS